MAYGLTQSVDLEASSSQYLDRADTASLSITGAITLEGWIKIESLSNNQFLITKQGSGSTRSWQLQIADFAGTKKLTGYVSQDANGNTTSDCTGTADMSAYIGAWCHVAFTWDVSSAPKIYLNGTDISSGQFNNASSINDSNSNIALGSIQGSSFHFDGRMSLWRVWSTARSQAQISSSMCSVLGSTANLAAEWTLNNVLTDNSGNANTLSNNGSATFGSDVPTTCTTPPGDNFQMGANF